MTPSRPETLDQFVGQQNCRRILNVLIAAARKRGEPVPHLLLAGQPGLGKTSLARIVAKETGGRLVELVGSSVKNISELTKHLLELQPLDVLFLDEIHALPRKIEEVLYPAMEDRMVMTEEKGFDDLMKQIGIRSNERSKKIHNLPAFTLVGATTLPGLVSAPLRSRFGQTLQLEPYSNEDLQIIVTRVASKLGFELPQDVGMEIARRSRGTARIAVSNVMWLRDFVLSAGGIANVELMKEAFALKGIDENGLTNTDRELLRKLVEANEPLGIETLASTLGESTETISESVEPFLLRLGYITKTPRGRIATDKARELFKEIAS